MWYEGTVWWRIWEMKENRKSSCWQLVPLGELSGREHVSGPQNVRQVLWHFPQTNIWWLLPQAEDTADILGEASSSSSSSPPTPSPTTEPPPPCLNILHLFNYLAATLWFGPELQWKLYLPIRARLVTGAGQISPSRRRMRERDAFGHITQEEMSLPHCRLVISSLWSPRGSEDLYACEGVCATQSPYTNARRLHSGGDIWQIPRNPSVEFLLRRRILWNI